METDREEVAMFGGSRVFVVAALWAAALASVAQSGGADSRSLSVDADLGLHAAAWSATDSSLYVAGNHPSSRGDVDIVVRRLGADGRSVWQRTVSSRADEYARGAAVLADGSVVVVGWRETADDGDDALIVRFDARGNRIWLRLHDDAFGGDDRALAVATSPDGIWVAGRVPGATAGSSKVWWSRWGAGGRLQEEWVAETSIIGRSEALGIAVRGARVAIVGNTFEVVDGAVAASQDAWVAVADTDGVVDWSRRWGRAGWDDTARALAIGPAGEVYVTGDVASPTTGDDIVYRRYTASGRVAWTRTITRAGDDSGRGIALSPAGDAVVVAGVTGVDGFDSDAWVRAVTTGGSGIWDRSIDSPGLHTGASTPDAANAVVVPGPVFVVGRLASTTDPDMPTYPWTSRLTRDQGLLRWSRIFEPFPGT